MPLHDQPSRWFVFMFCVVATGTPVVLAREPVSYHVHPRGSDDNLGTSPDRPWRSIARANGQQFKPGDRLLFAGGETFEGNLVLDAEDAGTADHPVVVGSYGQGRAVLKAGLGTAVLIKDAGGVEVRDLVCEGADPSRSHGCGVAFVNTLPGDVRLPHVRIDRVEAIGFGRDVTKDAGKPEGFQSPSGCGLFVGGEAVDSSKSGFTDIAIRECWTHHNEFGALITGAWDAKATRYANAELTITDCRFSENPGDPGYHQNHSGSGLLVEDTDGGVVERCTAWENGAHCDRAPGGPCGLWTAASRRVAIQNCEAFRNRTGTAPDGDGFDLEGGCIKCI